MLEGNRMKNYIWIREKTIDEPEWVRAEAVNASLWPRPLVLVTGAFDLLHCGHMRLLFAAREKAGKGTVLCAMDSDRRVQEERGPGRPILNWVERSTTLRYMPVDYIAEVDSTKELGSLIEAVAPDLLIEGNIHNEFPSRFEWLRKAYIRSSGMHTDEIVQRCVKAWERSRYK